jgi:hypothetical protein
VALEFGTRLLTATLFGGLALLALWATVRAAISYEPGTTGWDVSWPQCDERLPRGGDFAIVGVNQGIAFSQNPCLSEQLTWASNLPQGASLYVNLANPGTRSTRWPEWCTTPESVNDEGCAYEYGQRAAAQAFDYASETSGSVGLDASQLHWWLDVEVANTWDGTPDANFAAIEGYRDYLLSSGVASDLVGIYSTSLQWSTIAGENSPGWSVWVAGARAEKTATQFCGSGFAGGEVVLVQYFSKGYDGNLVCGGDPAGNGGGKPPGGPKDR